METAYSPLQRKADLKLNSHSNIKGSFKKHLEHSPHARHCSFHVLSHLTITTILRMWHDYPNRNT